MLTGILRMKVSSPLQLVEQRRYNLPAEGLRFIFDSLEDCKTTRGIWP